MGGNSERNERRNQGSKKKEEKWEVERAELIKKVNSLERNEEEKERRARKNNIIITGAQGMGNSKDEVQNFIKNEIGVDSCVINTYTVGKKLNPTRVIATLETWQGKMEIMKNKSKLRGKRTYIDNNLTIKEREVQKTLQKIAQAEREKNNLVRSMAGVERREK